MIVVVDRAWMGNKAQAGDNKMSQFVLVWRHSVEIYNDSHSERQRFEGFAGSLWTLGSSVFAFDSG